GGHERDPLGVTGRRPAGRSGIARPEQAPCHGGGLPDAPAATAATRERPDGEETLSSRGQPRAGSLALPTQAGRHYRELGAHITRLRETPAARGARWRAPPAVQTRPVRAGNCTLSNPGAAEARALLGRLGD